MNKEGMSHADAFAFEKVYPLHAQCAAALGWTNLVDRGDGLWIGKQPETGLRVEVPAYGQTWCATGPLVERFNLSVIRETFHDRAPERWVAWAHTRDEFPDGWRGLEEVEGKTPCEAIARVVIEIHRKKDK